MMMMPPPMRREDVPRVPPPKNIADVPRFLRELIGGFFSRLGYIFALVWQTGPWILFVKSFIALFQGAMPIVGSLLSKEILNELQKIIADQARDGAGEGFARWADSFIGSTVMFLLIFLFTYRILNNIIGRISTATTRIAGELVVRHVKTLIMTKAAKIDHASFDMPEFYEKLENANREAGHRPIEIISNFFAMISTVISFVGYLLILSRALPLAAAAILVVSFPSAIVNFIYRRKNWAYMRFRSRDRREMNYYSDVLVNKDLVKEIRLYDLSGAFIDAYQSVFKRYFAGLRRLIIHEGIWHVSISLVSSVVNCVCYGFVAYGVFSGRFMIGDYSLYTGALNQISTEVGNLINNSASIYEGTLFIDNLLVFLHEEQKIVPEGEPLHVTRGIPHTIEFQHVSFHYPGTERNVIRDVNLTLRPGETAVLVGLNGAGKTTLIKLLTRLYDPTEGRILLDGEDLRRYDTAELYKMFGIIFQDFGRYAVTVSENIHFGDVHRTPIPDEIREAAVRANVDEYISNLPEGYDTPLMRIFDREGTELSGGQWQKLAIARAFYSTSDILILDEPTASLDAIAEQEIFNTFDQLRRDKTTIFVSHRLSSATVASKIVVLEYGEVVEEGTHAELMEKRGKYYELFSTQAKRYVSEGERINGETDEPAPESRRRFPVGGSDDSAFSGEDIPGEL
ncbi:MAG: ABC transporter ATP-binding protein [Clostridia bacterium]|nr:ABC transporter ATP-binding protein [Clostridia bacterium]